MLVDESPISLPKALKNAAEIKGMKKANVSRFTSVSNQFKYIMIRSSKHLITLSDSPKCAEKELW